MRRINRNTARVMHGLLLTALFSCFGWAVVVTKQINAERAAAAAATAKAIEVQKARYSCTDQPHNLCKNSFATEAEYNGAVKRHDARKAQEKKAREKAKADRLALQQYCSDLTSTGVVYIHNSRLYVRDILAFYSLSVWQKRDLMDAAHLCTGKRAIYSHYTGRTIHW